MISTMQLGGAGIQRPLPDPFWANVTMLMNYLGADAATVMRDEKDLGWTVHGNAQLDTGRTLFEEATLLLDGTGDWLHTPNSSGFDFGSGDFTIEAWVWPNTNPSGETAILVKFSETGGIASFYFGRSNSGAGRGIAWYWRTGGSFTFGSSTSVINFQQWNFVSVSKVSGTLYYHINGTQRGSVSVGTIDTTTAVISLGAQDAGSTPWNGSIKAVRVTKGVGRYGSANYSVPTGPFPTFGP